MLLEYTEEIHAQRLLKLLNIENPCLYCPAARNYRDMGCPDDLWDNENMAVCKMCWGFLDYPPDMEYIMTCPCLELGDVEALASTYEKLKEKGYANG